MTRAHFSEFTGYGFSDTPTLALMELNNPMPTFPVCLDLASEWSRDQPGGFVSQTKIYICNFMLVISG